MGKRQKVSLSCAIAILMVVVVGIFSRENAPPTWYGYVASCDHRIHHINLDTGELVWSSSVLEWMNDPTGIDIDLERSVLYVASGSMLPRRDYIPIVAVRLNDTLDTVFQSYLYSSSTVFPSTMADGVKLNPALDVLYVSHLGGDELLTVLDSATGEILGDLDLPMWRHYEISPDGNHVAEIFPSGSRMVGETFREWTGGVSTWDLRTGEKGQFVQLEENRGLVPPWGAPDEQFFYVKMNYDDYTSTLEVYNRYTGELLASHDFRDTFEFGRGGSQMNVVRIPGREDIVMTIGGSVVVFDPITAEIKSRTIIPENSCTNVVITDKPLIRSESH